MAKLSIMGIAQEQESRAPPVKVPTKRRDLPEPISHLASMNHIEEIRRCLTQIETADEELMKLDEQLEPMVIALNEPNVDPWDRLEVEEQITPLLDKRYRLEGKVSISAGDIAAHVAYLEGSVDDHVIDDIGRQLIQGDGILERVSLEVPGIMTHGSWQRLVAASCPF